MYGTKRATDPVCGMVVDPATAIQIDVDGGSYYFCEFACADTFSEDPQRWIRTDAPLHEHALLAGAPLARQWEAPPRG